MSASSKKKLRKEQNVAALTEKQQKEQAEAKKTKRMTIGFVVVMIMIVCAFLVTQVISAISRNGVMEKSTIALTVNDRQMNSVEMNYYFVDAVESDYYDVYQQYGDSASYYYYYMGLDLTKPLNEQYYNADDGITWADFYWDKAVDTAASDYALCELADKDPDFELDEENLADIDNQMMYLSLYAYQFGSVDAYLRNMYGQGASQDSYKEYLTRSVTASAYYNAHGETLVYSDPDWQEYNTAHYHDFSAFSFNSYYLECVSYLPESVSEDDATKEQMEAAQEAAKNDALSLCNVTTVDELDDAIQALAINAENETAASIYNGDVKYSQLYENYAQWLSAEDRVSGDMKVFPNTTVTTGEDGKEVETIEGYEVVFFVGRNDYEEPMANVRHLLVKFEGGTTDDEGNVTYSAEDKAAAKEKADGYLQTYLSGNKTEESFIALVKEHSEDTSAEAGGLFEDINPDSQYVSSFLSWSINPERVAGDVEVIESEFGYHVMYYVGDDEMTYREYMIDNTLRSNALTEWHTALTEPLTVTKGDTTYVKMDLVYSP